MFYNVISMSILYKHKKKSSKITAGTGMKVILFILFITVFSTEIFAKNVYSCEGQATMCVRKAEGLWRADICDSGNYIFVFNSDYSELQYDKLIGRRNGVEKKVTEFLKCKTVTNVSKKRNSELLGSSNGRLTCIDFDGSQLGIPEVIEEVVHISSNKDRFAIYPKNSHAFLMNGLSADTATFGKCT